MTGDNDDRDRSLADRIGMTRRRLLGSVGGIAAGIGAGTTGALSARGDGGWVDVKDDGSLYRLHWKHVSDSDDADDAVDAYPADDVRTREEMAAERHETAYAALSKEKREPIDRDFGAQFSETRSPTLEFGKLRPGTTGSIEFGVHVLERPLHLRLKGHDWDGLDQKAVKETTATIRHLECPENVDGTITEGSLIEVLTALKRGVPIDGNRSHGTRGAFDEKTTHRFELEWEVPKGVEVDEGHFEFGFEAKAKKADEAPTTRRYTIHAIDVEITYNQFGTRNPEGAMYVLEENLEAVREAEGELPGTSGVDTSVIEPLVIRANEGDTVEIEFVNSLGQHPERDFEERPASIHPTGIAYEVDESDGKKVGFNENTIVESGESITYTWHADQQGVYFFHDGAFQAWDSTPDGNPEEVNSMARGLFGAIMVEPPGSTWTDPCTGAPLRSGVRADIHHPELPDHREFVPIYHDHGVVRPDDLTVPGTDIEQMLHAINYRAERTSERMGEIGGPPGSFYSSWVFGDPGGGDNVFEAYQGDPIKFAIVGANPEENHVHHLHEHRWNELPFDEDSRTLDSQNLGMGTTFEQYLTVASGERSLNPDRTAEEAFEVGAGGDHGSIGDMLFHCHMFPHYGEGMNGFMRVHNKRQLHLQPLPNNAPPLPFDSDVLGFPDFIPGELGEMPPKPPFSQPENPRQSTETERESLPALVPGAPYTDPCHADVPLDPDPETDDFEEVEPDIVYDVVAIPTTLVYNDHGDYDPDAKVFVLEEDVDAVLEGELMPEPLFIRANVGDCIELNLRNELGGDTPDPEVGGTSLHTHFVRFDALGSDGFANGFNYDQGTDPSDTMTYRWFADEEGTIFFHDHIRGIGEIMHGEFGALIVEPEGSEWLDPHTGEPIRTGSQAIIDPPEDEAFREFCLLYHDFAPLIDASVDVDTQPEDPEDDAFVNPLEQHGVNAGVGAINYRNAPYYRRGPDPDPAYVHSSFVHGDPETPTLETYPGDQVRLRWVHGPYEEQHNYAMHGLRLDDFGERADDTVSKIVASAEAFNFEVREADTHDYELQDNAAGLPIRDYLYGSMVSHDLWDGMWGIHRVFDAEVDHLQPLPGREPPKGKITEKELKEMGHPAPFDRRRERGHRVKLSYDGDVVKEHVGEAYGKLIDVDSTELIGLLERFWSGTSDLDDVLDEVENLDLANETDLGREEIRARLEDFDGARPPFPPDRPRRRNRFIDGNPPPQAPGPGDPCPDADRIIEYDVTALTTRIDFNEYGDHDPHGIVFALDEHVPDIKKGDRHPDPLLLRANVNDCIELTLTNALPEEPDEHDDHPRMRTPVGDLPPEWPPSNRVSLHPNQLVYDVNGSDGATVGFNYDQTAAPGESITYRWFADREVEPAVLWDMADVRSHRHHGAFGQLIVEPEGSKWFDARTGEPTVSSREAIVTGHDGEEFREFALSMSDARYVVNEDGTCVVPVGSDDSGRPCNQIGDPEDQGYMAFNNRSEPFRRRFDANDDRQERVYDSTIHGDPATPVFNAHVDDPVRFRLGQTADASRGISWHLANHRWPRFRFPEEESPMIGVDARFSPGKGFTVEPEGGAGGTAGDTGDFVYKEMKERRRLESGAWGIFRVDDLPHEREDREEKKDEKHTRERDPVQPLPKNAEKWSLEDRPGWTVATGDFTGDGRDDVLIGVPESDRAGANAGAAYLFYGPVSKDDVATLDDANAVLLGEHKDARAGIEVSVREGMITIDTSEDTRYALFGDDLPHGMMSLSDAHQTIDLDG